MREDYKNLIKLCTQVRIRRDILRMVYLANYGVALYKVIMNYDKIFD